MILIQNTTFNDGDLLWQMYVQTDFIDCTFLGTARNCNFAEASFTGCVFDQDFTFVNCNLGNVTGLPERLAPLPRFEPPISNRGGRPGTWPVL